MKTRTIGLSIASIVSVLAAVMGVLSGQPRKWLTFSMRRPATTARIRSRAVNPIGCFRAFPK